MRKMRTETKTVSSTSSIFNVQGCILTDFHICALHGYWLTWGTGEFLSGKAKRCFRDWPFVYFHLSGDSANFNMWKSDFKNKRYQETGMEYFTKVQMIVKDEGYKYFAGRATCIWCLIMPTQLHSAPQTHAHTNKKDTVYLMRTLLSLWIF